MYNRNNEKLQQKRDSGYVSRHYPDVKSITINMEYNQRGIAKPIHRIINFLPDSYAFFRIDCLNRDCDDGGFDLTAVIESMVRNHGRVSKGDLSCESNSLPSCKSDIIYEVAIQYA